MEYGNITSTGGIIANYNPSENRFSITNSQGKLLFSGDGPYEKWARNYGLTSSSLLDMSEYQFMDLVKNLPQRAKESRIQDQMRKRFNLR